MLRPFAQRVLPRRSEATSMGMSISMSPPRSDDATAFVPLGFAEAERGRPTIHTTQHTNTRTGMAHPLYQGRHGAIRSDGSLCAE